MLGTVGSGKSTVAAGIVLTAQTLSADRDNFVCRVLENTTNILQDASQLRRGRFPQKTSPYQLYAPEAGLLMLWKERWSKKKVQVPICDVAGEDIQEMIRKAGVTAPNNESYLANARLIQYVKDSDGFILVVPSSRAAFLFDSDFQLEKEAAELVVDPDVNLARILSSVISHKDRSRGKPIKGIAVVVTKWDLLEPFADNLGINFYKKIYTNDGKYTEEIDLAAIKRFMAMCFPATSMELKASGLGDMVQYFPSHFTALRDLNSGAIQTWPDGTYKIKRKEKNPKLQRLVPEYSEKSYIRLFEWLRQFAQ
jgi:hypothetical protein